MKDYIYVGYFTYSRYFNNKSWFFQFISVSKFFIDKIKKYFYLFQIFQEW